MLGLKASRWYLYFIPGSIIFFAVMVIGSIIVGDSGPAQSAPAFTP